jgi:DNA (cytosine-5)-methyltransferase 1
MFGSVCSGIEAASVAWHNIGWRLAWLSEIEPFPCALLGHHYPTVANLGDMTCIADKIRAGEVSAPDVFVGGTPCQAFSVAGLRGGLSDPRGALTIAYVEIADEIDKARIADGLPECVTVWENVPGVLSDKSNAFGCFLGALAGEDCELQPPGGKWKDAGCVFGPKRAIAWRILDAQFFGVAQRRRRVFVVASARNGFDPAAVLFEREGLRRDIAPSREPQSQVAALTANGVGTCGADDNQAQAGHLICMAHGQGGAEIAGERSPALTCNHEAPIIAFHPTQDPISSTDGSTHAMGCGSSGGQASVAVAFPIQEIGKRTGQSTTDKRAGIGIGAESDPMFTLQAGAQHAIAMSVSLRGREGGATAELGDEVGGCLRASGGGGDKAHVLAEMAVRRLTPTECERLQGFPDGHTNVPYRGKPAADGPRYKALGNSMAVPVMRWIGQRINDHIQEKPGTLLSFYDKDMKPLAEKVTGFSDKNQ